MVDKKSMLQALNDFSQKIKTMSNGGQVTLNPEPSAMKNLQTQINQQEEDRLTSLQTRFSEYLDPVTQDIEKDEEDLLKAYELFVKLVELNKTAGDNSTHLKSFQLTSPLCRKTEYTAELPSESFSLLRLWFVARNPEAAFVPEIVQTANSPDSFTLDFIDIDMWQQTSFEKEVISLLKVENN